MFWEKKKNIFGRYFKEHNTIYVTKEIFSRPDYFAHELAHHFYYICNVSFITKEAEEDRVYMFQDFYYERTK